MSEFLPNFPKSRKLTIHDKNLIEKIVNKYPPYSDFNFLSLWSYDTSEDLTISRWKDNIIIRMRDYITNEPVYSFIGSNDLNETADKVFTFLSESETLALVKYVPEVTALKVDDEKYVVTEDRDNFDYIFSINALTQLHGTHMHKLRNYVNRFKELYPTIISKELDLSQDKDQFEVLKLFDEWKTTKGPEYDAEHERIAIVRTIQSSNIIKNMYICGLYDDEKLIAFFIGDTRFDRFAQGHFAKALTSSYHGITSYLYNQMAKFLETKDIEFINLEQDLGIEGLRRSKEQMHPVAYLKKYTISLK